MTTTLSHGTGKDAARSWHYLIADMMVDAFDVAPGEYTVESVAEALQRSHMRLWMVLDEARRPTHAMVTEIRRRGDDSLVLFVCLCSGEGMAQAMRDHWGGIVDWAKQQGCACMIFGGRPGWRRSGLLPVPVTRHWEVCELPLEVGDA